MDIWLIPTAIDDASTANCVENVFKAGIKLVVVKNSLLHKVLMNLDIDYLTIV